MLIWWLLILGEHYALSATVQIEASIAVDSVVHVADERFLSVALDCSLITYHWKTFDPTNAKVISLARGLSPAILRLGGTACDYTIFNSTENWNSFQSYVDFDKFGSILKIEDWDRLVHLANLANWTLLFDANVMLRDDQNRWNPANFKQFLLYNQMKGNGNMMFELGNEPNNFPSHFNRTITGPQLAEDFSVLRSIVHQNPLYKDSKVVGADVGNPYKHRELLSQDLVLVVVTLWY